MPLFLYLSISLSLSLSLSLLLSLSLSYSLSLSQMEEYLEKTVQMFSYLTDKDLFAEIYRYVWKFCVCVCVYFDLYVTHHIEYKEVIGNRCDCLSRMQR